MKKKRKPKPQPEPKPFWDTDLPPAPKERHPIGTITIAVITLLAFGGGYVTGRPRTIHIIKTDATKSLNLKALPGEACKVSADDKEWRIICGLK